jgi:MFS superfamily sulfate permease-like transporter
MLNTKFFKQDIAAGIVVFLVALPLCLGIALASGAPFFSGMISGIIGGIVIGVLSNSNLSVSGPAAGLAALVLGAIASIGDFRLFLCAVVIAGIIQLLMGFAKLGGIANYFPSSVIKGMLTSIGILIIAKQIPKAFGYDKNDKGDFTELFPFGDEDLTELFKPLNHIDVGVFVICIISIAIMLIWDRPFIKNKVKFIPGALVAVFVAVILNVLFQKTGSELTVTDEHLVRLKIPANAQEFFGFFTLPNFSGFTNSKVLITGVMIAIIASLETLLCIEAVDNIDPERHVTNTNRELFAQGIGNIASGLIGGLPITSVIVRSSANINAGAKTKISAIFHGVLLLVCVVAIPRILNLIPISALAAILLLTGYKLCKISIFKEMIASGKQQYIPFFVTVISIISIDLLGIYKPIKGEGLLIGVGFGLVAAIGSILIGNLKNAYYFDKTSKDLGGEVIINLSEEVSFLNKAAIKSRLDTIAENTNVTIDASNSKYIDYDVLEIIKEFKNIKAPIKNINCTLIGLADHYEIPV